MRTSKTNLSVIDNTGTRVQPRIVVGEGGDYKSGDILDANAVVKEVQKNVDKINKTDTNAALDKVEEFSTFLADVDNTKTLGELLGALDSRLQALENVDSSAKKIIEVEVVSTSQHILSPKTDYMENGNPTVESYKEEQRILADIGNDLKNGIPRFIKYDNQVYQVLNTTPNNVIVNGTIWYIIARQD